MFDDASRLRAVVSKTAGVNQSKTEFVYDGASMLRVSKTFTWSNGAWVSQGEKRRVYDGMNAVQERDGQGALVALYVRGKDMGGGIGGLLARVFDVDTSFMHYDGRGNVVQLTNNAGVVSGKYIYDAFGRLLSITGGAAGLNPYRFSTKEHVGSLVYYGYRFYSPSLGKWINRDPIEELGGTNVYAFTENSPLNFVDTYGLLIVPVMIVVMIGGVLFLFPQPAQTPTSPISPMAYPGQRNIPFDLPGGEAFTLGTCSYFGPRFGGLPQGTQDSIRYHEHIHTGQSPLRNWLEREMEAYTAESKWLQSQASLINKLLACLKPGDPRRKALAIRQQEYLDRKDEVDYYIRHPEALQ